MNGDKVALDTNQAIAVLNNQGNIGDWIKGFSEICLPVPVLGELIYGALNSSRVTENLFRVHQLSTYCHVLCATEATADVYARTRLSLKRKGNPIPENDLWIAAICIEKGVPLATDDTHFNEVDQLQVIRL